MWISHSPYAHDMIYIIHASQRSQISLYLELWSKMILYIDFHILKTKPFFSDKSWEHHKYIYININVIIVSWQHYHLAKPQQYVPIKACELLNYKVETRLHHQVWNLFFLKHALSNQKAAGWPSSTFYCFTRTFIFVSKPVLILLLNLIFYSALLILPSLM